MSERFQILSLDGGGIRGLFSAAVLASIEEDLKTSVVEHFDLIAGTSTGGIIAIGLGLGMRPREIVEFYLRHGPDIFRKIPKVRSVEQWFRRQYSAEPLGRALREAFKERRFGESTKRLVIPAYNLGEDDVYVFRTPHLEQLKRDYRLPAWKVGLATAAAPSFFTSCREIDGLRLIDGGVWANNPAMVALVEAVGPLRVAMKSIRVLSIGTYDAVAKRPSRLDGGGKLAWVRGGTVVDLVMRAQSIGITNHVRFLLEPERFLRIDPKVPAEDVTLDTPRKADELIARAAHYSRVQMPSIAEKFSGHTAAAYEPFHQA